MVTFPLLILSTLPSPPYSSYIGQLSTIGFCTVCLITKIHANNMTMLIINDDWQSIVVNPRRTLPPRKGQWCLNSLQWTNAPWHLSQSQKPQNTQEISTPWQLTPKQSHLPRWSITPLTHQWLKNRRMLDHKMACPWLTYLAQTWHLSLPIPLWPMR